MMAYPHKTHTAEQIDGLGAMELSISSQNFTTASVRKERGANINSSVKRGSNVNRATIWDTYLVAD